MQQESRPPFAAIALAAAFFALAPARSAWAQSDQLPLTGLTTPQGDANAAAAKKKKAKAKGKDAPAAAAPTPIDPGGAFVAAPPAPKKNDLPEIPLLNLSNRIGVKLVRTPLLDEATSADLEAGMRGIAFQAPLAQNPIVLRVALDKPCASDDDACFVAHATPEGVDSVVIAVAEKTAGGVTLHLRQIAIAGKKKLAEAEGEAPLERLALKAESEALLCKMIVPAGCSGDLQIDAGEADILYEGRVLPKGTAIPMRATLPVGIAPMSAKLNGRPGPLRMIPVLREKQSGIALSVRTNADGAPTLVTPAEVEAQSAPAAAVADVQRPASGKPRWVRPAAIGVAGAGAILLATGLVEGLHSKSLLDSSQAAYNANGGAYRPSDLDTLKSGNSAAHTANLLLLIGGIAAAAGLTVALVF